MTIRQLSDGNPDGNSFGQSTSDKISFYNVTPVVQPANTAAVATTGVATGAVYGFTTAAQGNAAIALLNQIRADLVTLGLKAGS